MTDAPQNPNQAIDAMSAITVTHVVLMIVLAAAMVAAIWWGVLQSRRRRAAEDQVDRDFATAEQHNATTPAASAAQTPPATEGAHAQDADTPRAPEQPDPAPQTVFAADLTQIKGLGPKLAATLAEQGITRVDQIAALTPEAAAALDATLGTFQGRITRDRWVEQSRLLSAGDRAGYEAAFGKLGG